MNKVIGVINNHTGELAAKLKTATFYRNYISFHFLASNIELTQSEQFILVETDIHRILYPVHSFMPIFAKEGE